MKHSVAKSKKRNHKQPLTPTKKIRAIAGSRKIYSMWLRTTKFVDGKDIFFVSDPRHLRGISGKDCNVILLQGYELSGIYDSPELKILMHQGAQVYDFSDRKFPALGLQSAEAQTIIEFLFPLARRYVDGRESSLANKFNEIARKLVKEDPLLICPDGTPWARSTAGRKADGLTDEEAAKGDPIGMWQKDLPNEEIRRLIEENSALKELVEKMSRGTDPGRASGMDGVRFGDCERSVDEHVQ